MAKHRPAPEDHRELRAVWLSPEELADLDRAADKRSWSRAKYAEKAILEKVKRDLSPPVPNWEDIMDRMQDLPADQREQAAALVTSLLMPRQPDEKS